MQLAFFAGPSLIGSPSQERIEAFLLSSVAATGSVGSEIGVPLRFVRRLGIPLPKHLVELFLFFLLLLVLPIALSALLNDGSIVICRASIPVYAMLLSCRRCRSLSCGDWYHCRHGGLLHGWACLLRLGALDVVWIVKSCECT